MRRIAIACLMVVFGFGSSLALAGPASSRSGAPADLIKGTQTRPAGWGSTPTSSAKNGSAQASPTSSASSQADSEPNSLLVQFGPSRYETASVIQPASSGAKRVSTSSWATRSPTSLTRPSSSAVGFTSPNYMRLNASPVNFTRVGFTSVGYTRPSFTPSTVTRPSFTPSSITRPTFTSTAFTSSTFTSPTFSQLRSAR